MPLKFAYNKENAVLCNAFEKESRENKNFNNSKTQKIMKTTKNFQLSNNEVKTAANKEIQVVNTNPTYLMRKLNKIAQGKDQDTKEVEGFSKEAIKELFDRLTEAFNCGGFWWGSIIARQGFCITAARKVTFAEGDETNEDIKGCYSSCGRIHTEVINGEMYSLREASTWSYANIISSASLNLKFAEAAAKANSTPFSWMVAQAEAKKKQQEIKKEEKKQQRIQQRKQQQQEAAAAKKIAKQIQDLKQQVNLGLITPEEFTSRLAEIAA